jgi:hypothetical protein
MTTTATRINVTDLDPAELLAGLHNNTVSPDTWACNLTAKHRDITVKEAQEFLDETMKVIQSTSDVYFFPDYVFGRPIKAILKKGEDNNIYLDNCGSYDRDAGEGKALMVVNNIRNA